MLIKSKYLEATQRNALQRLVLEDTWVLTEGFLRAIKVNKFSLDDVNFTLRHFQVHALEVDKERLVLIYSPKTNLSCWLNLDQHTALSVFRGQDDNIPNTEYSRISLSNYLIFGQHHAREVGA